MCHGSTDAEDAMSREEDNVQRLREAYGRWAAQKGEDPECWLELAADDATLRSLADGAPEMRFTRTRRTKSEVRRYLDELTRDWEMVSHDMSEFIAQGDRVVVVGEVEWRNRGTRKAAKTRKVDIWLFRDGKAVGFEEFYDTARLFAAAQPDGDAADP
jgi:uncharacterized protein